jgi:2-keto-3-deoxy-L-rhamnonate aldolase RhmA
MEGSMKLRATLAFSVLLLLTVAAGAPRAAGDPQGDMVALLAAGKPVVGVWTGATGAPRIAKVLGTSDADFIVADIEHEIYDFNSLHRFVLEIQDFSLRYRTAPRATPGVIVKLGHRSGWDPRFEIAETMRLGPVTGVMVPMVESGPEMQRIVSTFAQSEQTALQGVNVADQGGHTAVSPLWPLNPKGRLMVIAMIETEEGVKNAKDIIQTPGLAAVHTVHVSDEGAAKILKLCLDNKVVAGIDANPGNVKAMLAAGYKMISVGWDCGLLQRQLNETFKSIRSAMPTTPSSR